MPQCQREVGRACPQRAAGHPQVAARRAEDRRALPAMMTDYAKLQYRDKKGGLLLLNADRKLY